MVLESIFTPKEVEKQPLDMILIGFGVTTIGLWLAFFIFPQGSSMWLLFLTTLALVPLIEGVLSIEEEKDIHFKGKHIFKRHYNVIWVYLFLFIGMLISLTFWYVFLPQKLTAIMFSTQLQVVRVSLPPSAILFTNLKLLLVFILLALVFGAGAILFLTWDAAITAVLIGSLIKQMSSLGTANLLTPLSYIIFEIIGYSLGAIAGGILSVAIIKKHYKNPKFDRILLDVTLLICASVLFTVAGAVMRIFTL